MSETEYISCTDSITERIARIDAVILALELQLLPAVETAPIDEYQLDDGQVKIKTVYRTLTSIMDGLKALDLLRNRLINRCNGAQRVLRPWQGLSRN